MISTLQKHTGNNDNGPVVNLPAHLKPGVMMPTPENLQAVADKAAAQRNPEQAVGQIDKAAFAAENAAVMADIARHNARMLAIDAPEREAINLLAKQLAYDCGMPKAAAALLATRIIKLENEVSWLKMQQPPYMRDIERRG